MSNVIELLEKLGSDAGLQQLSEGQLAKLMGEYGIDENLSEAILLKDRQALEMILGANTNVLSLLVPAEEDEEETEGEEPEAISNLVVNQ